MQHALKSSLASLLYWIFYGALASLVLTFSWKLGWNLVGDPYALGPYASWLELVFPLAGLGLWGAFFSQWAIGSLRALHITRWFYLLLFATVLMVNVLLSVNPASSLGWLCIWLTGSLVLSLSLRSAFEQPYFWVWYVCSLGLSLGLWWLQPALVNPTVLMLAAYLAALHAWQQTTLTPWRYGLSWGSLLLGALLPLGGGVLALMTLSWTWLWAREYRYYRRQGLAPWYGGLFGVGLLTGALVLPGSDLSPVFTLPANALGNAQSWLYGVGWGQLEWAQYATQTQFQSLEAITTNLWAASRWWYETGLLMLLWLPALWLLSVGHGQNFGFRTALFWGIVLLAPGLWMTPGGILLGCFWFFNRQAWEKGVEPLTSRSSEQRKN